MDVSLCELVCVCTCVTAYAHAHNACAGAQVLGTAHILSVVLNGLVLMRLSCSSVHELMSNPSGSCSGSVSAIHLRHAKVFPGG